MVPLKVVEKTIGRQLFGCYRTLAANCCSAKFGSGEFLEMFQTLIPLKRTEQFLMLQQDPDHVIIFILGNFLSLVIKSETARVVTV